MISRLSFSFAAGALLGLGLVISGLIDFETVRGFLDLQRSWNPTLVFVLIGTLLPMQIARIISNRLTIKGEGPVVGGAFSVQPGAQPSKPLLIGAVFFGIGWGLTGLLPNVALASVVFGGPPNILYIICFCIGLIVGGPFKRWLS